MKKEKNMSNKDEQLTEHTNSQAFDTFLLLHLLVYALAIVVVALDFLVWRPN